ncbi:MAG: YSIRK-type signal peptide-containing protein, partial [Clostridia bacterium]|nr:YSIRK-type signal peptide-containing protein [Clostridia bacterium]
MVSKNNSHIYKKKMNRKDFRYSIRKLNVGVASVLVGITFGLGAMSAQEVAAAEISDNQASTLMPAPTSEQSKRQALVEITNNQKENPQQIDDMLEENKIQNKEVQAEVNLNQAQGNLEDVAEVKNAVFNGNKTGWNQKYWPQLAVEVQEILYDDGRSIVYRDKNDKVVVMERIGNSGKYRPKKRNTDELLRRIFGFDHSAPIINLSATIKNMGLENDFYEDTENQVGYYSISKASISKMTADKIVAIDYLDDFFRVPLSKHLQILDENKQVVNPEEMLAKKLYKVLLFATDMANLTSMKSFNVVLGKMAVKSKAVVDKTELKNVIANRSIIVNKNQITLDDGTSVILDPADKAMLVDIIIEAEKVLDDQNASQDKVDYAKRNLEAAVEAIKEKAKQKANELNNVEEIPNQNDTKPNSGKGSFVVDIPKDNPTDEKTGKDSNEETPVVTQVPSDYPTYDLPEAAVPEITEVPKDYPTYDLPEAAVP